MTVSHTMLQSITHDLVLKELADGSFKSSAGWRKLYDGREKLDGGLTIGSPVILSGQADDNTGGFYSGAAELSDSEKEDIARAYVQWKQAYETVLIAKSDINKNKGSKTQILGLLTSKVKIAMSRFDARLASSAFGDGTTGFNGLQEIIKGSGDYAGLAVGDIKDEAGSDAWLAQVTDISAIASGALTERHMQNALGKATEGKVRPDWAAMKQDVYNEVWSLLSEHQRILVEDTSLSNAGHDQRKILIYNGIPHLIDSHMKAQSIYYINSEFTKFYVHQDEDMASQKFPFLESSNALKERLLIMGNLFCNNRNKNAELSGIAVAA